MCPHLFALCSNIVCGSKKVGTQNGGAVTRLTRVECCYAGIIDSVIAREVLCDTAGVAGGIFTDVRLQPHHQRACFVCHESHDSAAARGGVGADAAHRIPALVPARVQLPLAASASRPADETLIWLCSSPTPRSTLASIFGPPISAYICYWEVCCSSRCRCSQGFGLLAAPRTHLPPDSSTQLSLLPSPLPLFVCKRTADTLRGRGGGGGVGGQQVGV